MAEYLITKREKCEACDGHGYKIVDAEKGIGEACPNNVMIMGNAAPHCVGGYIETSVDLLSVLAELRFSLIGHSAGSSVGMYNLSLGELRIEE